MFRKVLVAATLNLLAFICAPNAEATCSSYPYTLTNGTTADAAQVMANLNCAALTSGATLVNVSQLGIGTSSPSYPLQIFGTAGGMLGYFNGTDNNAYSTSTYAGVDTFWVNNASTTTGTGSGIGFSVKGSGPGEVASIAGISTGTTSGDYSTALIFQTRASGGADGEKMRITASGNVGIGTTSPSYTLHVNGSVAGTSAYNNLSDARLKKDVTPLVGGLALISQLQPVRFDWRSEDEREVGKEFNLPSGKQIGFIAQDLGKVLPEAVSTAKGKDAIMSVAESKVVPVLVAAVKELKAANDNQAAEIDRLESRVVVLERKVQMQTAAK